MQTTEKVTTIELTTIYLELRALPPAPVVPPPPRADLTVMRAERPTVGYYRFLYDTVGEPWRWYERRLVGDEQLAAVVQHQAVEVQVLYAAGVPAGYAELDRRIPGEVELAYFGLMPSFIGQGLGTYLLRWAIQRAFTGAAEPPARLWVHTCDLDHPRALATYLAAGFVETRREKKTIPDPRGLM